MRRLSWLLVLLAVVAPASAQITPGPGISGVLLSDEGTVLCQATSLNFVGNGVTATCNGGVQGVITVTGGGAAAGVNTINGLQGDLFLATGTNINIATSGGNTFTVSTVANPVFSSVSTTNLAITSASSGGGFASCLQVNAAGEVSNAGSACGTGSGGVTSLNLLTGDLTLATGSNINITTSGGNTFTVATVSNPTFASISTTNIAVTGMAAGGGFSSCVQVNSAGEFSNTGSACGSSGGGGVTSINSLSGALTFNQGHGLYISSGGSTITYSNAGVEYLTAGTGISVDQHISSVTVTNTGVTSISGTPNQVNASAATGAVTLSTPQNIDTGATITFASIRLTNVTAPSGFASCIQTNANGILTTTTCTSVNGLAGALSLLGTTNRVTVATTAANVITLSGPQDLATSSSPTFASILSTNAAAGSGFASCVQINSSGVFYNTGASCTSVNTLQGRISILGTTNQVNVTTTPLSTITLGTPQDIATTSTPTFASLTITNQAAGSGFASCVAINAAGTLFNSGSACGTGGGSGVTSLNALTGAVTISSANSTNSTNPKYAGQIVSTSGQTITVQDAIDIQAFTASGASTWTKPVGCSSVYVIVFGAGGGGGSGRVGISSAARSAGSGGGGGASVEKWFRCSDLASSVNVYVGNGGLGAASVTGTNDGINGSNGEQSFFGHNSIASPPPAGTVAAGAGGGGKGGTTTTANCGGTGGGTAGNGLTGGSGATNGGSPNQGTGFGIGGGGAGCASTGAVGTGSEWGGASAGGSSGNAAGLAGGGGVHGCPGAGAGGSLNASNAESAGGDGGTYFWNASSGGGATGGGVHTNGNDGAAGDTTKCGTGGGGGGSSGAAGTPGGTGGHGGIPGGGGGGGGAGTNAGTGGAGGNGGHGSVYVITY